MIEVTKKRHIVYYIVCALSLIAASVFIVINPTHQPPIVIALLFLMKLPLCFALTYIKDREDTALVSMYLGLWLMYEVIVITCLNSLFASALLFGTIALTVKNGEDIWDFEGKSTPKHLVAVGVLLHLIFIFAFAILCGSVA